MKHIKLFGMDFDVDGKWLIGSSKDIDKLSFYVFLFVFSLIFDVCIIYSLL
jgi:hypothetical protein